MVEDVALASSEYKAAERVKVDFWLYVVYNYISNPDIH
jgi:hypothetical protein